MNVALCCRDEEDSTDRPAEPGEDTAGDGDHSLCKTFSNYRSEANYTEQWLKEVGKIEYKAKIKNMHTWLFFFCFVLLAIIYSSCFCEDTLTRWIWKLSAADIFHTLYSSPIFFHIASYCLHYKSKVWTHFFIQFYFAGTDWWPPVRWARCIDSCRKENLVK